MGRARHLLLQLLGQRPHFRHRLAARRQLALQLLEAAVADAELGAHVVGVAARLLRLSLQVLELPQLLLHLHRLRLQLVDACAQRALLVGAHLEARRGRCVHRNALRLDSVALSEERQQLGRLLRQLELAQLARLCLDGRVGGRRHRLRHPLRQSVHVRAQPR